MDWMAIIQMIIAVLTTVLQILGGSNPLLPQTNNVYHLADNQWECGEVYWSRAPAVRNRHFTGTVAVDCRVEGLAREGLSGLEEHLIQRVPQIADEVHAGPIAEYLGWLPSTYHELSYDIEAEDEVVSVRGESHVATDGHNELRSVFRSVEISQGGSGDYLKKFIDELQVIPVGDGWYEVQLLSGSRVEKPWGMSDEAFKDEVSTQLEERIEERREPVLNDVANHL